MYSVSSGFKTAVKQHSRVLGAKVVINGNTYYDDKIVEMVYEDTSNSSEAFSVGDVSSAVLELTVTGVNEAFETATVTPYIGVSVSGTLEYVPLGVFYVDVIDKKKNVTKLTCYDGMIKLEKGYFSNLTYPATITAVMNEICSQAGVQFSGTLPGYSIDTKPEGYTHREMVAIIAAMCGGFAKFNRSGQLVIKSYATIAESIAADQYIEYVKKKDDVYRVDKVTCQVSENNTISKGTLLAGGSEVTFSNPYVTDAVLTDIYNKLNGFQYMPFYVKFNGNPALECGDIITFTTIDNQTYNIPIMSHKLMYSGGLVSEIESVGETQNSNQFSSSGSLTQRVDRVVYEQAIINDALVNRLDATNARIDNLRVTTAMIDDLSVTTAKIADAAITNTKIANAAIDNAKIANAAIGTAQIQTGAITNALIANAAIQTANIADASVTNAKIQDGAITNAKIANATIGTAQIADASITTAKIQDAAITNAKIANLDASKITTGYLDAARINTGSITISKLDSYTQLQIKLADISKELQNAKLLNTDPTFSSGVNGTIRYDNSGGTNPTWTRVLKSSENITDSPITTSNYVMKFYNDGSDSTSPGYGGFYFATPTRANALFVTKIVAKIPVGYNIAWASNAYGTGGIQEWLTPTAGTGNWETYICKVKCGSSGTFSTTNFFYFSGSPAPSTSSPLTVYVAFATVYDCSNFDDSSVIVSGWRHSSDTTKIDGGKIYTGTITADKIAVGTITAASGVIADAAITTAKIADASITNAKIANLAVDNAKIADASITSAKIQDGSIANADIADATITGAKIANATITGANIASATIDTANIKAGAITTALIGTGAVGTAQIADGSITDAKIVSLTANKITAGTIDTGQVTVQGTNGKLRISGNRLQVFDNQQTPVERVSLGDVNGDGTVYGLKVRSADGTTVLYDHNGVYSAGITDGAVTNPKISSGAVDNRVIAANAITADKIVAGTITGDKIASNTITANNIAANTITAGSAIIADGAITSAKIANAAIGAAAIANAAIGTAHIADGAITNAKIANLAVDNAKISNLHGSKIIAGTIASDKLVAGGRNPNLIYYGFDDFNNRTLGETPYGASNYYTTVVVTDEDALIGVKSLKLVNVAGAEGAPYKYIHPTTNTANGWIKAVVGKTYIHSAYVKTTSATPITVHFTLVYRDASGTTLGVSTAQATITSADGWKRIWNKSTAPANTVSISYYLRHATYDQAYTTYWDGFMIEEAESNQTEPSTYRSGGVTLIDGGNIITQSITGDKLVANAITAGSAVIADGAITTAKIADAAITNAKIADATIDNAKIASLHGSKIIAGTITADKLNVTSLSAVTANLGSITGGSISLSKLTHDDILLEDVYKSTNLNDDGVVVSVESAVVGGMNKNLYTKLNGSALEFYYSDDFIPGAYFYVGMSGQTLDIVYDGAGSNGTVSIAGANLSVGGRIDATDSISTQGNFSVNGTLKVDTLSGLTNTEIIKLGGTSNYVEVNTSFIGFYSGGALVGRFANLSNSGGYALIMAGSMMKSLTSSSIIDFRNSADNAYIQLRASAFTVSSKREYKENIKEYDANALDIVANTKVYTYNFKENEDKVKRVGLIVDEAPSDITLDGESIDTYAMISVLWKAVQELADKVENINKSRG